MKLKSTLRVVYYCSCTYCLFLSHHQETNKQCPGRQSPPPEPQRGHKLYPPASGFSPGLGQQRPGAGCPVHHPPAAAGLAASVLPGGPPAEGGDERLQAAHPEVSLPTGSTAPTPRLSDAEGRHRLESTKPAHELYVEADSEPEGGAGQRGTADLGERTLHMVKHNHSRVDLTCDVAVTKTETVPTTLSFFHRNHFVTCCSAFDQLGAVVAQMPGVEQLFTPATCVGSADNQPAITQSLQYVRGQVEAIITEFTTWKTQLLSLGQQNSGECPDH